MPSEDKLSCNSGASVVRQKVGAAAEHRFAPVSGHAAWAGMLKRSLVRGDTLVVLSNGCLSQQWAGTALRLGLKVELIGAARGEGVPAQALARRLGQDLADEVRAVFVMHTEASTGVVSDLAAVRRALDESFHDALLLVDATAGSEIAPSRLQQLGTDAVLLDRKGLLGTVRKSPTFALSERMAKKLGDRREGEPLLIELDDLSGETENSPDYSARIAAALRCGVSGLGLGIVARHPGIASDAMTVIRLPHHVCARDVIALAMVRCGIAFQDGLGELAGQVLRIRHGASMNAQGCLATLTALGRTLEELGAGVDMEAGLTATRAHFWTVDQPETGAFHIAAE